MKEIEIRLKVTRTEFTALLDLVKQFGEICETNQDDFYYCGKMYKDTNTTKNCPYVLRIRISDRKSTLAYKSFVDGGISWIEEETGISDTVSMRKILQYLDQAEYLCIKKHRISIRRENIEVNLDEIEGLGFFIELEIMHNDIDYGKSELHRFLRDELRCETTDVVDKGYVQLMEESLANEER